MNLDWDRRQVVLGGLLTVLPLAACPCTAHAQQYSGCWMPDSDARSHFDLNEDGVSPGQELLVEKSGVEGLEGALIHTLDMLSVMFGVQPGFSFYQERGVPNAKATNLDLMKDRPDGTVLFGVKLLKDLLALPEAPDAAVMAVCAHEFAHVLSYSNKMIGLLAPSGASPLRAEQFADYMAGYFAGRRKLEHADFPAAVFAVTTSMYGGGAHGTAIQRGQAVEEGFLCAYYRKEQPQLAAQRAFDFAMGAA